MTDPRIAAALGGPVASLIDGEVIAGTGAPVMLTDPATEETLAVYPDAGAVVAERAHGAAEAGGAAWRALAPAGRAAILTAAAALIRRDAEALAAMESLTAGKPITDARAEVGRVAEMFAHYAGWPERLAGRVTDAGGGRMVAVTPEPLGTVVQITPWNAPLFTAGWQLAPALAAGNAAILKPSEFTPVTSLMLARLLIEAGVPPGAVTVVAGLGATAGAALVGDARCGKAVFIGSVETGRRVAATAAAAGRPALLELGGKSANMVFADADLDAATAAATTAIFGAAGQSCTAGARLLVERAVHAEMVERMAAAARALSVGPPADPATRMGPLQGVGRVAAVTATIAAGVADGARLVAGGGRPEGLPDGRGFYVAPTVLADVTPAMRVWREEIFGPVLCIAAFDGEEEAVALANGTDFDLAGAVWSRDGARALRVARRLRAGTVWINGYRTLSVAVPFGGMRGSGFGRSSGPEVMAEYTQSRAIWMDPAAG